MTRAASRFPVRRGLAVALIFAGAVALSAVEGLTAAQPATAAAIKVGILPFVDATGSGSASAGVDVGRTMQAEMVHSTELLPRVLPLDGASRVDELDGEKAVEIGRKQKVDVVFLGTVLEARSEESNRGGWLPSIKGQSAGVQVRSIKATVTLQGELYSVASGNRLNSWRVVGKQSDNKFGGTAYTTFGSWGSNGYAAFLGSPLGKALQAAIADMVKKVAAQRLPTPS